MTTTPAIGADAPVIDLLVNQGSTFRARLVYRIGGVAQSLEGYAGRLSVAKRKGATPIFTLTSAPGDGLILEGEGQTGTIDIEISAARTSLLRRSGFYDLLLVESDDLENIEGERLFQGAVRVSPAVTRLV